MKTRNDFFLGSPVDCGITSRKDRTGRVEGPKRGEVL